MAVVENSDVKVLEERIKSIDTRVESVEHGIGVLQKDMVEILVELRVLGTRVGLYSGIIAFVVSTGITVLLKVWK